MIKSNEKELKAINKGKRKFLLNKKKMKIQKKIEKKKSVFSIHKIAYICCREYEETIITGNPSVSHQNIPKIVEYIVFNGLTLRIYIYLFI